MILLYWAFNNGLVGPKASYPDGWLPALYNHELAEILFAAWVLTLTDALYDCGLSVVLSDEIDVNNPNATKPEVVYPPELVELYGGADNSKVWSNVSLTLDGEN